MTYVHVSVFCVSDVCISTLMHLCFSNCAIACAFPGVYTCKNVCGCLYVCVYINHDSLLWLNSSSVVYSWSFILIWEVHKSLVGGHFKQQIKAAIKGNKDLSSGLLSILLIATTFFKEKDVTRNSWLYVLCTTLNTSSGQDGSAAGNTSGCHMIWLNIYYHVYFTNIGTCSPIVMPENAENLISCVQINEVPECYNERSEVGGSGADSFVCSWTSSY